MTNTENLVQSQENRNTELPLKSFHGLRYSLYTLNLLLLCIVVLLSIISVVMYAFSANETPVSPSKANIPENSPYLENSILIGMVSNPDEKENEDFDIVTSKNIFSAARKEWVTKPKVPKNLPKKEKKSKIKRPPPKPPRKIVLYGIIMAGKVKKAMINNPKVGVRNKKTIYVEEGEDVEGYKVKSIEKDRIIMDWQGNEMILKLYTGTTEGKNSQGKSTSNVKPRRNRNR